MNPVAVRGPFWIEVPFVRVVFQLVAHMRATS